MLYCDLLFVFLVALVSKHKYLVESPKNLPPRFIFYKIFSGFTVLLFFKNGPTPASFLFYFRSFQTNIITILTTNTCEEMSIQYMVLGFAPTTFGTWNCFYLAFCIPARHLKFRSRALTGLVLIGGESLTRDCGFWPGTRSCYIFKYGPNSASFCLFSSFYIQMSVTISTIQNEKSMDLNPGLQDGRHSHNHRAFLAAHKFTKIY